MFKFIKKFIFRKSISRLMTRRSALLTEKEALHDWKVKHYKELIQLSKVNIENAKSEGVRNGWKLELADNTKILNHHQKESDRIAREIEMIDEELARLGA